MQRWIIKAPWERFRLR